MRRSAAACVAFLAAACTGSATGPSIEMRFSVAPAQPDTVVLNPSEPQPDGLPPTLVTVDGSTVRISGYFATPCMRDAVQGTARRDGASSIRVLIRSVSASATCATRPDSYTYEGLLHHLDPGTYRMVVVHERDARRADGVVVETSVTLP